MAVQTPNVTMFPNAGAPFLLFAGIDGTNENWTVGAGTAPGTPVVQGTRAGVTLTGSADYTASISFGPYTVSGIPRGGIGLTGTDATVATTGTFYLPVVGATTSVANGTEVYYDATAKGLTLTETDNVAFGVVNLPAGFVLDGTHLPVKIGVSA